MTDTLLPFCPPADLRAATRLAPVDDREVFGAAGHFNDLGGFVTGYLAGHQAHQRECDGECGHDRCPGTDCRQPAHHRQAQVSGMTDVEVRELAGFPARNIDLVEEWGGAEELWAEAVICALSGRWRRSGPR